MRILIVEDDKELNAILVRSLKNDFSVDAVTDFQEAADYIEAYNYRVVLLDRNLNGIDHGLSLIQRIKEKNEETGILVASSYGSTVDKIEGLETGADDYIEKPYDIDEVKARINAIGRRFARKKLTFDDLEIDLAAKRVSYKGNEIRFTKKESQILFFLVANCGKIVSRDDLLYNLYQHPENVSSNTIDVTINNIRKKLPFNIIKTVKTRGYVIEKEEA